jgi:glutamate--cysteine ligase
LHLDRNRLKTLTAARLAGMRRGIEKESLRIDDAGRLASTPHPAALGSALTHPQITTDFSESQLELITGARLRPAETLDELRRVHQFVYRHLGDELLWTSSMPCDLPADEHEIPLGRYGSSNVATAKTVYRAGLSWRYGRRMQTISGIHYNWSLPGLSTDDYFALIRNFRRHSFLLLVLFGASPALAASFGAAQGLQPLGGHTHYLPHATSLRMGRLGYQSDAQSSLCVSYNCLDTYAASLHDALTRPYPAYEAIGLQGPDGEWRQLSTTLLQIENEFYGTIRPKRTIRPGERPLHALRERGVEYVEVRCMDLNPFLDVGIDESTMRLLDLFLLHCVLSDSPNDTPGEIAELAHNQQAAAARGREPGLTLRRAGEEVPLQAWAGELLQQFGVIAELLDAWEGDRQYGAALDAAQAALRAPETLPSARVVQALEAGRSHRDVALDASRRARETLLARPWSAEDEDGFAAAARASLAEQAAMEAADTESFADYRARYISAEKLGHAPALHGC